MDFFEVNGHGRLKPKTIQNYETSLRAVAPLFSELSLDEIRTDQLKQLVRERRKTVSDTSVKRDLAFVSSVFSHAIGTMPQAPETNPVLSFSKRHLKEQARTRWLRPHEYDRLIESCQNPTQALVIKTATLTGMRHTELSSLRKGMINFQKKEVILDVDLTKNGKERVVPLCASLCFDLEQLCLRTPGDLVFCYMHGATREWRSYQNFSNFWDGVRTRANLKDVRFHDLRHTFASWWVQANGDLLRLRDILGHSSLQMVQRYAHLNTGGHHAEINEVFETHFAHSLE